MTWNLAFNLHNFFESAQCFKNWKFAFYFSSNFTKLFHFLLKKVKLIVSTANFRQMSAVVKFLSQNLICVLISLFSIPVPSYLRSIHRKMRNKHFLAKTTKIGKLKVIKNVSRICIEKKFHNAKGSEFLKKNGNFKDFDNRQPRNNGNWKWNIED